MKKTEKFKFRIDWFELLKDLSAEETKILLMRIFEYNEGIDKPSENQTVERIFEPIKKTLDKDFEKQKKVVSKRSEAREGKTRNNENQRTPTKKIIQ